ncbi:MAG: helix-turn-helix domain-containing protein [Imperialibacter sp.]|uniref:helix-turn-helix domain-containing protein n=1 Tax=Imperialibacter sp. TaxID=2038411 RepID=UPI0032EE2A62
MKFEKHLPTERLKPYIRHFVVSESELENEYKVFPTAGLVIGFQYKGQLATVKDNVAKNLATAGITSISDSFKVFKNAAGIGSILVYFTETGFTHFASHPANELFNLSLSLEEIFSRDSIGKLEEKLFVATSDQQRIRLVELFLLARLKNIQADKLIVEAVRLIYQSKGTIRIQELNHRLAISQSPFEKRFRKVVGTSPKKFASIVRFNTVLDNLSETKSLTEICYEHNFFDQAHFIKNFKQFTGDTPEQFKRLL